MSSPDTSSDGDYAECLMGSMVTPGEYWLINKDPIHTMQVREVEQELSAFMEENFDFPNPTEISTYEFIVVEHPPDDGGWKRAKPVARTGRGVFTVFLIDFGLIVKATLKHIRYPLDPRFLRVEPLAFKFCLYGTVPCTLLYNNVKKVAVKWTDESRILVTRLLSKREFFHIKILHMVGRTLLGDIYLFDQQTRKFYSLVRLMCAKNLAVFAESYYRERVMGLDRSLVDKRYLTEDSEVSIQMDTKLKRMEELRLVNMHREFDWTTLGNDDSTISGFSDSDESDEFEESALCDENPQLVQELIQNLDNRFNLRPDALPDLPQGGASTSSNAQHRKSGKKVVNGPSVSSDLQNQRSNKEVVGGSHSAQSPLESGKRKPRSNLPTEKQAPRPPTEKETPKRPMERPAPRRLTEKEAPRRLVERQGPRPLMEIEIPKSVLEKSSPRPLMEVKIPKSVMEKQGPKPSTEKQAPRRLVERQGPRPLMEIEIPKSVIEKSSPRPLMNAGISVPVTENQTPKPKPLSILEFPRPSVGLEIPKPLDGIEFRKPLVRSEGPKPLGGIQIPKPSEGTELAKPPVGVETPKPVTENQIPGSFTECETSRPSTEKVTLRSLMELGIPQSGEKDKASKERNGNLSNGTEVDGPTDEKKKNRKGFKIIFDEKNFLPGLEVPEFQEIFHVFFDNVLEPLDQFKNLNISKILFKNIERQVMLEKPTPIQKWAIPSIVNGDDLVIVGQPKSGKTMSYILGVLEVLKLKMEVGQFHLGKGPLAVILSSSSKTCEFIFRVFTLLITRKDRKVKLPLSKLNVRYLNNAVIDRHSMPFIVNRCDVLISTPQCFLRILNNRSVTYFNKLNLFVFDGADVCVGEPFLIEMKILLNQSKIPKGIQKIFCGERWTHDFEVLTKTFIKEHSAVIGSFLEAAAYAKLQPKVFFVDAAEKERRLLDLILKEHKGHKVMVVCNDTEEVLQVEKYLKSENKTCFVAHSGSQTEELKNVRYNWGRSKEWCVVLCTESIIEALGIYNADGLINYSLPSDRETSLGRRFLVINNKMKEYIFRQRICPTVEFLVDDKTYFRLPELMDYLQRQKVPIPPGFRKKVNAEIEASEKELPLCDNILKFGNCKKLWRCNQRHNFIKEVDAPKRPLCGIIKFTILKVHSTSHFSARIHELSDQQNKYRKIIFPDLTLQVTRQLRNIFRDKSRRTPLRSVKVDAICVLNRNDASGMRFHRAKVVEIKTYIQPNKPDEVIVKLIDWGCVLQANVGKLLELPEEMKVYPPLAMDMFLCNLGPKDFDREWSDRDVAFAQNMFMMDLEDNQTWIGRIKLSLETAILVDPVKLCHTLENESSYVIEFSASQRLIYSGIADERPDHLKAVYALCEKADIDTSIYEYNLETSENVNQSECAHFDNDFVKIQFIYAESPTSLYVRISKFEDLLINLEAECDTEGVRQKNSMNCNLSNPVLRKKLSVGKCCLALNGTSWNRAKILAFEKDRAKVFFIDYGDTDYVENVVPITERLLTKLPGQAIQCYLVGVDPEVKISEKVLAEIYDFSKNGSEELCLSVVEKSVKSEMTGGWKYGINLLNGEGKSLNKKLIDMGLVQPTKNHLDLAVDMENKPVFDDGIETDFETWDDDYDDDKINDKADFSQIENLSIVDSNSGSECNKDIAQTESADEMSYFLKMESGAFDDDNACCMLEEFLCNLAPEQVNRREPQKEGKTDEKEGEPFPENNEVTVQEEARVDNGIPLEEPEGEACAAEAPAGEVNKNDSQLVEAAAVEARLKYLAKRTKPVKKTLPYLKNFPEKATDDLGKHLVPTDVFTPEILWSQTHTEIEVKIMLTNVAHYKFDCSVENFIFRCFLDQKPYVSHVRLFGAVNPEMTRIEIKTFFVQIIFQKLCPLMWPRLCKENKKFRWIKYNIEHFKEKKSTISEILCSQAMERIKSGNIIVPKVSNEIKFVPSSSSEDSDWSDSELEEFQDLSSHHLPSDRGDEKEFLESEDCHSRFRGVPFRAAPLRVGVGRRGVRRGRFMPLQERSWIGSLPLAPLRLYSWFCTCL